MVPIVLLPLKGFPVRKSAIRATLISALVVLAAACLWDYLRPVTGPPGRPTADLIVIKKAAHRMLLLSHGQVRQVYSVALGRGGAGPKTRAGDNKVPEGTYRVVGRNPHSVFHLSLRISYPTREQVRNAQRKGIDPGGDVMIHGIRKGLGWIGSLHREVDLTRGCVAVTNAEIEEIWRSVPDGTTVIIKP